nr:hypothetical protein I308_06117 [Cryptococcus tetragattii IND107]
MIIELPCRQDCWSASNSFAWARRLHTAQTIPQALQSTLAKDWSREWFADEQLDFARLVVIHALAALAWDLAHRDLIYRLEANGKMRSWSRTSKAAQAVLVAADFLKQSIQLVLWAFHCCHSDGSDWVTRSLQAGNSSLEGVEQRSSSHNLQQRARKAIEYCEKAAAHARSGNPTSPGAENLGELGHIAIEIMQGVHADIGEPLFIVSCMASSC